jgi:hypothetical protein
MSPVCPGTGEFGIDDLEAFIVCPNARREAKPLAGEGVAPQRLRAGRACYR